jgi:RHS repeat-associated protein
VLDLQYSFANPACQTGNNGNMLEQKISVNGSVVGDQTYCYDKLNRLTQATETYNSATSWARTFNYDQFGNMYSTNPVGIAMSPGAPQAQNAFVAGKNQIASCGYDPSGNMTSDGLGNGFVYDGENHQTSCTVGGATSSYTYDGDGHRITKTTTSEGPILFVYDVGSRLIAEYGGQPTNTGTSYLTTDHLGSTRVVTNSAGTVVSRHDYLPFGEEIQGTTIGGRGVVGYGGLDDTKQRFTSKERDVESGLDYFLARYYSSTQGRFVGPDPLMTPKERGDPQAWNTYGYCDNNPLRNVDPDGQAAQDSSITQAQERDIRDLAAGKITRQEYQDRQNARAAGGAIGLAIVGGAAFGRAALGAVLGWIMRNPATVLQTGEDLRQASNGNPAGGPTTFAAGSLTAGEAKILEYAASGRAFEKGVLGILGVAKNTSRILNGEATGAAYRVPDILDKVKGVLGEIKGAQYLSYTGNLKDFINYAGKTGISFNLYVRPGTTLSRPLVQQLKNIGARVYDVVDGRLVPRTL